MKSCPVKAPPQPARPFFSFPLPFPRRFSPLPDKHLKPIPLTAPVPVDRDPVAHAGHAVADIRLGPIRHHLGALLLELCVCDFPLPTTRTPLLEAAEEEEAEEGGADAGAGGDDGDLDGFGEGVEFLGDGERRRGVEGVGDGGVAAREGRVSCRCSSGDWERSEIG